MPLHPRPAALSIALALALSAHPAEAAHDTPVDRQDCPGGSQAVVVLDNDYDGRVD